MRNELRGFPFVESGFTPIVGGRRRGQTHGAMGGSPLGQRLLIKLAANVSAEELAGRLDISQSLLTHLISGALPVPDAVLLKAVDVMLDEADALLPPPLAPRPSTKRDA